MLIDIRWKYICIKFNKIKLSLSYNHFLIFPSYQVKLKSNLLSSNQIENIYMRICEWEGNVAKANRDDKDT